MKLPGKALRTLLLLPDTFCGSVTFHRSASGVFSVEVVHRERYSPSTDEMLDLADTMHTGGLLECTRPRR